MWRSQKENILIEEKDLNRFFGRPLKNSQSNLSSNSILFEKGGKIIQNNDKKIKVRIKLKSLFLFTLIFYLIILIKLIILFLALET